MRPWDCPWNSGQKLGVLPQGSQRAEAPQEIVGWINFDNNKLYMRVSVRNRI